MTDVLQTIQPIIVGPRRRAVYYRFMHVFIELLERFDIKYFAHSGTMLGCVRHQGFIPWDDDIDLMIPKEDVPRLERMVRVIENYGIRQNLSNKIKPEDGLWQFMPFGPGIMKGAKGYMGLDIFVGEIVELKDGAKAYHYMSSDFRRWYENRFVKVDDTFPRKRYTFGPLSVWGMRDPTDYFERSGFQMNEAIIGVHKSSRAKAEEVIAALKEMNQYPIDDKRVLSLHSPYAPMSLFDLDHYYDASVNTDQKEKRAQ